MKKLTLLFVTIFLFFPSYLLAEKVGSYATYKWRSKVREGNVLYRTVALDGSISYKVVKEPIEAKPFYFTYSILKATENDYLIQIVAQEGKDTEPLAISQILVDRKTGKNLKAVIKSPKGAALPFSPVEELTPISEKAVKEAKKVNITVEAGSYECLNGTFKGQEVYVSDKIPTLGIIKATLKGGMIELVSSSPAGARDLMK